MKYARLLILVLALLAFVPGCKRGEGGATPTLNLFAWSEYIPQEVIDGFTRETKSCDSR